MLTALRPIRRLRFLKKKNALPVLLPSTFFQFAEHAETMSYIPISRKKMALTVPCVFLVVLVVFFALPVDSYSLTSGQEMLLLQRPVYGGRNIPFYNGGLYPGGVQPSDNPQGCPCPCHKGAYGAPGQGNGGQYAGVSPSGQPTSYGDNVNGQYASVDDPGGRGAQAVRNGLLGQSSQKLCARGANNILSYYVFGHGMDSAGANAKDMGPVLQQRYGMRPVVDTGSYRNGDTRVLQSSGFGHMEVYMNGRWYSDFPQNGSLMGSGRYSSAVLYRLP